MSEEPEKKILFQCEGYRIIVADTRNVVVEAYVKQVAKNSKPNASPPTLKGQVTYGWVFRGYHSSAHAHQAITAILAYKILDLG